MTEFLTSAPFISFVKIAAVAQALLGTVAIMTWIERRLSAMIQFRLGPNRVGPAGLFQPVADGIKFIMKQELIPRDAHKPLFVMAPALAMIPAVCAFAVIPFGPEVTLVLGDLTIPLNLVLLDLDGGVLFALAFSSLGVYGIVCAGWASRSKYALMGGLRASAQMISYELAMGLALVGVLLVSGTLRPTEIVAQQAGGFWTWNIFGGWQLVGFVIFVIAGFAETNRLPFDMPEAESELVAGYHTEYSSMKFSMFFMAEYIAMTTMASLVVTLYLGGYQLPVPVEWLGLEPGWLLWILQILCFVANVGAFLLFFVWGRWTLPRCRYDQLMDLGWKRLFPLALVNLMFTAVLVAFDVIQR